MDLNGPQFLDVHMSFVSSGYESRLQGKSDIEIRIPVNVNAFNQIIYQTTFPTTEVVERVQTSEIQILLTREGSSVPLELNGLNWWIVLHFDKRV